MNRFDKDSHQRLNEDTGKDDTAKASTVRPPDDPLRKVKRERWLLEVGRLMVEHSKRMEVDPVFRREVQKKTR